MVKNQRTCHLHTRTLHKRQDRTLMNRSIQSIVLQDLCVGCGTCYSVCLLEAITLTKSDIFKPVVDAERCNNCGLCEIACPGVHVDYKLFATKLSKKVRHSFLVGRYTNTYLGNAKNHYLRFMGSSGGVATAILSYALEKGIINGALVVASRGLNPEIIVAKSPEELEQAMGSKYIPVPLNAGLRSILSSEGHFAFVGLPCHLLGLNRMTLLYPALAKKIVLKLGLFCGRGFDYHYVNFFLRGLGISPTRVQNIRFRGHGWPGKVFIEYTSESGHKKVFLDSASFGKYSGAYLFTPKRCIFCPDHTAELADISFGDAPFDKIRASRLQGIAIIVTRTALGDKILSEAMQGGFIDVSKSSLEAVVHSQSLQLHFHKISLETKRQFAKALGMSTPLVNVEVFRGKSLPIVLFSVSLIMTQAFYKILKMLRISEFVPKPLVRIWSIFHLLVSFIGFSSAIRSLKISEARAE